MLPYLQNKAGGDAHINKELILFKSRKGNVDIKYTPYNRITFPSQRAFRDQHSRLWVWADTSNSICGCWDVKLIRYMQPQPAKFEKVQLYSKGKRTKFNFTIQQVYAQRHTIVCYRCILLCN